MSYLEKLLATARRHRSRFDQEELRNLEAWVEAMKEDPEVELVCDWLRFAAATVVIGAKEGMVS